MLSPQTPNPRLLGSPQSDPKKEQPRKHFPTRKQSPFGVEELVSGLFFGYFGGDPNNWRGKNLGHSDLEGFKRTKVQNLISPVCREKRPEFRRKRDLYEPLLTAMAQVLASLTQKSLFLPSYF